MANVNIKTGKIYGAKEGTKVFYHEEGHLFFEDKCKKGNQIRNYQELSIKILIFFIAFQVVYPYWLLKFLIIGTILVSIFSELYEELWCWDYAKKTLRGLEDDKNTKKTKV